MISIQTNVNSLVAQQNLSVNSAFQSKTIAQLTSGYRINQSGDDAAGLAVANKFRSTVAELTQGVANGNDATAQLQIMDGGMNNISQILDRLKTLATQSASGTFTGNRTTLNSEFQNDLLEIDRQAQSIGLNTGGAFSKNLDVYLGTGSGSTSLQNGVVTLGLAASAVDSQSLGMKGMQAVAGSADLGSSSDTSVAKILADNTNKSSTATAGSSDFYFIGAGFSDASKVKVSVNLSGVTDVSSLVTALNSAIGAAGNGTSQAGAAFAKAGIVASAVTSNGKTQIAFTSSTAAFQVEAGDQMANALMGNYGAGPTGAAITTTVSGTATGTGTDAFTPTGKTVRIQGGGMAGPVDLTFSSTAGNVADAITDLINKVSSNSDLQAAGISLSGDEGSPLVFTSAKGESFSVMATGDSKNQLGLGSFVTNSSAGGAVDYKMITGTAYSNLTAINDQSTLEFSINGGAATGINLDLTAGDAVAAARTTSAISNPNIVASTASSTVGVNALLTHDWSAASQTFTVAVNGGAAQSVALTTNFTLGGNNAALLTEINNQLTGATASIDGGNHLKITANTAGTTGSVVFGGTVANVGNTFTQTAATDGNDMLKFSVDGVSVTSTLSGSSAAAATGSGALFAAAATVTITAASSGKSAGSADITAKDFTSTGPVTFQVAVDGGNAQTISLSGNYATGTDYANAINGQLVGASASYDGGTNRLSITSGTTGTSSSIAITDGAGTQGKSAVGASVVGHDFSAGGPFTFTVDAGDGSGPQTVTLNTAITDAQGFANAINAQLTHAHVVVSGASGDKLQFVSNLTGTSANITIADGGGTPVASYLKVAVGAGTAGAGPAVATYLHLGAGTSGVAGNNQMLVSSDTHGPSLVSIAAGTYGSGTSTTIQRAVNDALVTAGLLDNAVTPTSGVAATLDGSGNLKLTSTTVGTSSAVSVAAPVAVNGTTSSALGGSGIGLAAGSHVGGSATAASLAAQIQNSIDTATGTGSTNAHATVSVDNSNKIVITNDHKGASHTISVFTGNSSTGFAGTGAAGAVAGLNRSGSDTANALNQTFSSDAALAPANLKATWNKGGTPANTLTIESTNNTNFRINSGSTGSGVVTGTQDLTSGHNWSGAGQQRFALKVDGALSADIVLSANAANAAAVLTEVRRALTAASVTGVTASLDSDSHLVFTSDTSGGTSNVQVVGPTSGTSALSTFGMKTLEKTADADLGFGVSGASFASGNLASGAPRNHIIDAGGVSSAVVGGNALSFTALKFGNDSQAITISGNDTDGTQQSRTITLRNIGTGAATPTENRAGRNIDSAISYINQQLQASNVATLQKIVAVKEKVGSADQINFVSSLSNFNVSAASTANADGINGGASKNVAAGVVGTGANMQVDTKDNALAAVTAIATAIGRLGSAQAAVGKGQNQLAYAVNLAQSQITNFAAAESQIRDTNVAQQAANLSKAQVLSQASIAAMAQANSAPQAVLSLLRG